MHLVRARPWSHRARPNGETPLNKNAFRRGEQRHIRRQNRTMLAQHSLGKALAMLDIVSFNCEFKRAHLCQRQLAIGNWQLQSDNCDCKCGEGESDQSGSDRKRPLYERDWTIEYSS